MSYDVECPYCEVGQEINHDDGYGYDESKTYNQQCRDCEKYFTFTTSISFYYEAEQADCLNGAEHDYKPVDHYPKGTFPDWKRCVDCNHEVRGKYVEKVEAS